jgi:hypothetical protein
MFTVYYSTDNGSVVFGVLFNVMDNYSDRFDWLLIAYSKNNGSVVSRVISSKYISA